MLSTILLVSVLFQSSLALFEDVGFMTNREHVMTDSCVTIWGDAIVKAFPQYSEKIAPGVGAFTVRDGLSISYALQDALEEMWQTEFGASDGYKINANIMCSVDQPEVPIFNAQFTLKQKSEFKNLGMAWTIFRVRLMQILFPDNEQAELKIHAISLAPSQSPDVAIYGVLVWAKSGFVFDEYFTERDEVMPQLLEYLSHVCPTCDKDRDWEGGIEQAASTPIGLQTLTVEKSKIDKSALEGTEFPYDFNRPFGHNFMRTISEWHGKMFPLVRNSALSFYAKKFFPDSAMRKEMESFWNGFKSEEQEDPYGGIDFSTLDFGFDTKN